MILKSNENNLQEAVSMSFDIYDVSSLTRETAAESATDADIVESGLSSGELRQALMDRFREEIETESVYFINLNLGLEGEDAFDEDILEDEQNSRGVLTEIENHVYETMDSCMDRTIWEFSNEMILVRGEV